MEKEDNRTDLMLLRMLMQLINLAALILVCCVLIGAVFRAKSWHRATELAISLGQIPLPPWLSPVSALLGYGVLLLVGRFQHRHLMATQTTVFIGCLQMAASIWVILSLHMAFNSILLIVILDMVEVLKGKPRIAFLAGGITMYVLTSMSAVQDLLGIIPLENYLFYFSAPSIGFVQGALTLMSTLNLVLFIIAMVLLLSHKTAENARIQQLNSQLATMNEQLKTYASESERMAETRERNRLAREIHDTLGHALTGIASASDACSMMVDVSPDAAKKLLKEIGSTARQGITDVRRSVNALRPDALEHHALEEALATMAKHITDTAGVKVELRLSEEQLNLSEDEEDAVYRVVQEGITNAVSHGNASRIWISLTVRGQDLDIQVRDNGIGTPAGSQEGFGLLHMRERLNLLGGTLHCDGSRGFLLQAVIPLRKGGIEESGQNGHD